MTMDLGDRLDAPPTPDAPSAPAQAFDETPPEPFRETVVAYRKPSEIPPPPDDPPPPETRVETPFPERTPALDETAAPRTGEVLVRTADAPAPTRPRPLLPDRTAPATLTAPAPSAPSPARVAGGDRRLQGVRQPARPQGGFALRYPDASRRRGESGVVLVRATVGIDGRCKLAELERSSGYPALDAAALEAVRSARFVPATENGRPIEARNRFEILFQLD